MPRGYAYLFEAKGIQKYIFGSGLLRDAAAASDLLARVAHYDEEESDLVGTVALAVKPDRGFSRRGAGAFCAHFTNEADRDRFQALWRLTLSSSLPGLEFTEGRGAGDTDDDEIADAYRSSGLRLNSAAGVAPRGGPVTEFAQRSGRPATPPDGRLDSFGDCDQILRPARARSFGLGKTAVVTRDDQTKAIAVRYDSLLRRVLPAADAAAPPLLIPRNLSDEEADRRDNPVFPFPGDVPRLALVHADLSGLGELMTRQLRGKTVVERCDFSHAVEKTVLGAVQAALHKVLTSEVPAWTPAVFSTDTHGDRLDRPQDEILAEIAAGRAAPVRVAAFRPLVAGGDDVTILIGSEHALAFSQELLARLETAGGGLSACAGIAYVKAATPFLLAHELAEGLVKFAKAAAKTRGRAPGQAYPSALAFHSPTGSLGEPYKHVLSSELWSEGAGVRLTAGPYWLSDGDRPSLNALGALVDALRPLKGRGALRGLRTLLFEGRGPAEQAWRRWRDVREQARQRLEAIDAALTVLGVARPEETFIASAVAPGDPDVTPLFDAQVLLTLEGGER